MSLTTPMAIEPPKRPRSKPAKAAGSQGDKTKKVSFYLSDDSLKRLGVHATMDGVDRSSLVDQLIQEHLRRYDLPRRRGGSPTPDTGEDRQAGGEA